MDLLRYAKAFAGAAAAAGVTAAASALNDGVVTQQEWVTVIVAALVAGVAVFATPNKAAVRS